jgi:hypothetical protein
LKKVGLKQSQIADEIYKWFLAALLYGVRIMESVVTRTWREFERSGAGARRPVSAPPCMGST